MLKFLGIMATCHLNLLNRDQSTVDSWIMLIVNNILYLSAFNLIKSNYEIIFYFPVQDNHVNSHNCIQSMTLVQTRLSSARDRALSTLAPAWWNSLPESFPNPVGFTIIVQGLHSTDVLPGIWLWAAAQLHSPALFLLVLLLPLPFLSPPLTSGERKLSGINCLLYNLLCF